MRLQATAQSSAPARKVQRPQGGVHRPEGDSAEQRLPARCSGLRAVCTLRPYLGDRDAAGGPHHACQAKVCYLDMEARPVPLNGQVQQLGAGRKAWRQQQQFAA